MTGDASAARAEDTEHESAMQIPRVRLDAMGGFVTWPPARGSRAVDRPEISRSRRHVLPRPLAQAVRRAGRATAAAPESSDWITRSSPGSIPSARSLRRVSRSARRPMSMPMPRRPVRVQTASVVPLPHVGIDDQIARRRAGRDQTLEKRLGLLRRVAGALFGDRARRCRCPTRHRAACPASASAVELERRRRPLRSVTARCLRSPQVASVEAASGSYS